MSRHCRTIGLLTGLTLLVTLLAGCALSTTRTPAVTAATPTATAQPTATASPTAAPFFVDGKAYQRVTDSMSGYSFAIPADAQYLRTNPLPLGVVGDSVTWSDGDANLSNGLDVDFGSATGDAAPECPQAISDTTIVDVGSGIKGYQRNNLVIGPGVFAVPTIRVSFVVHGVVVDIQLDPVTHGDMSNLVERYGPIWQEMLASFQPGTVVNPTPPCGS